MKAWLLLIAACSSGRVGSGALAGQPASAGVVAAANVLSGRSAPAIAGTLAAIGGSAGWAGAAGAAGAGGMQAGAGGRALMPARAGSSGVAAAGSGGVMPAAGSGGAPAFGFDTSAGWILTIYYTPVESYHTQPATQVTGCLAMPCMNGKDDLGSYPADFVQVVKDSGTGRITSGSHAGKYLNWSIDIGYWLDDAAMDARGQALIPYVSAAADPKVPFGTHFTVVDCGVDQEQGTPINSTVCSALKQGKWIVNDRFTVGSVGAQFDLYIGEEDHADFDATSQFLITAAHAKIAF